VGNDGERAALFDAFGKDFFGRFAHGCKRGRGLAVFGKIAKARILRGGPPGVHPWPRAASRRGVD
jgi:hypothetical protein